MDTDWLPFACVDCGTEGRRRTGRGRPRLRCDGCREAYRKADRHAAQRPGRRCPACSGPVERGCYRTYCSDACRRQPKACEYCTAAFIPERQSQRFCSMPCAHQSRQGALPSWLGGFHLLACAGCGVEVLTAGTKVLCAGCREQQDRGYWRQKNRRRRAALHRVPSEPYTLREIAARDGYCCQLCRSPVDMSLVWPDRWSATIDHRMPLVLGGDDTRANVDLAHFVCNSRKGASLVEVAA